VPAPAFIIFLGLPVPFFSVAVGPGSSGVSWAIPSNAGCVFVSWIAWVIPSSVGCVSFTSFAGFWYPAKKTFVFH
jgi:hypothetical protein